MVKIGQLNNTHFTGYKCLITRNLSNHITALQVPNISQISIIATDVEAVPGTYQIKINLNNSPLTCDQSAYWYGTYDNASRIYLNNGLNTFNITIGDKQIKSFTVGVFANNFPPAANLTVYSIDVHQIGVLCVPNSANKLVVKTKSNVKSSNKPAQSVLPIGVNQKTQVTRAIIKPKTKQPSYKPILEKPIAIQPINNKLANIILVTDVKNWCFDNIAAIIKKHYDQSYNIHVEYCMDNPDYSKYNKDIAMVIKFWYGYENQDPFIIFPNAIKVVCIYDYIHWNSQLNSSTDTAIYKNFIINIGRSQIILYSCPMIKQLLEQQHSRIITGKHLYPVYDGVDINIFRYANYVMHNKLVVGWVGDTSKPCKRFDALRNMLKNLPWVEFVVQDKSKFISHTQMAQFYHKIDVNVCLSTAEGTPNPILEASACGRTWISTKVGIVETLYNLAGKNHPGFLIDQPTDLVVKLNYLYKNKNVMYSMGKTARNVVEYYFSWDKRVKSFGEVLSIANHYPNINPTVLTSIGNNINAYAHNEISNVNPNSKIDVKPNDSAVANPIAKPATKPIIKSEIKPEIKPTVKPENKPVVKPTVKPVAKLENKPESKPEIKPTKRESKPENKPVVKQEIKPAVKQEIKPAIKQEIKPVVKQEIKPAIKQEIKPAVKQEIKPVVKQEIKPVVKQESKQEIKPAVKQEIKPVVKQEIKPEIKPVVKQEIKPEIKPVVKQESKPEIKPVVKQESKPEIKSDVKSNVKPDIKPAVKEVKFDLNTDIKPVIKEIKPKPINSKLFSGAISKKIIVTSTQYPRYGGAATCAYELHKYLLSNGIKSVCIFFDNLATSNQLICNPDNLANVFSERIPQTQELLKNFAYGGIMDAVGAIHGPGPYVIYSFNYFAPIISKYIFPTAFVNYMITGCSYINNDNLIDSTTFINTPIDIHNENYMEKTTVKTVDAIIPNSDLAKNIFEHCYNIYANEFVDMHEIFDVGLIAPNANRCHDLAFVSSDCKRKVKNADLVKNIFNSNELITYQKICIGKNSQEVMGNVDKRLVYKDFLTQKEIISVLSNTKIVLIPSFIETYSITAVEATQCGCIIIANKNTACAATLNKFFVIESYDTVEWIAKIKTILNNYAYFTKIFSNNYLCTNPINYLWDNRLAIPSKINILCCSIDTPYIGGCATNTYRIIKNLQTDGRFNVFGIFISNDNEDANPDRIPNVYKLQYDAETENNMRKLRAEILAKVNSIDYVFYKNYKIFPFIKRVFNETKLVFSPSGLRSVSSNTTKGYVLDMDLKNMVSKSNINLANISNTYQFVKDNDLYLDDYAIKNSDLVIPNSFMAYKIINGFYPDMPNLGYPIYITNIIYSGVATTTPLANRKHDIMFCAYNWSRKCKNYDDILKMIEYINTTTLKLDIVIVGKKQIEEYTITNKNMSITRHDYLPNDQVFDILKNTKILVVPSKFESNPNIFMEAIICGCNVVTSRNVGNSENLENVCIVEKYNDIKEWINTILRCLHTRYKYSGPGDRQIASNIRDIFTNCNFKKSVGVYKIPPALSNSMGADTFKKPIYFDYIKATIADSAIVEDIINFDIYFIIFLQLSIKEGCTNINYILFDDTITDNMYINVHKLYPMYPKGVTIWKLKDIKSFSAFTNANFYFVRGTYYNFFNQLIPSTARSILYPATTMKQSLADRKGLLSKLSPQKFSVVLYHDDNKDEYHQLYNAAKFVSFEKFPCDKFVCYNTNRSYDLCYVATDKQATKNHDLFLHFLSFLEQRSIKCNVMYVGNLEKIIEDTLSGRTAEAKDVKDAKVIDKTTKLTYVNISNIISCRQYDLIEIYNKTKINIMFSGRDALPRAIGESAACGCFNIALDTLSDGKAFYDGHLGALIGDKSCKRVLKPGGSLSYVNNPILWEKVLPYLTKTYDHNAISIDVKAKYNMDKLIDKIYN